MEKFDLVGKPIPDLNLPDTRGGTTNLRTFIGRRIVILILLKGVAWGVWKKLVTDFASAFEKIKECNVELYPITTSDDLEHTRELETKYGREKYPIYCDQEKQIFKVLPQDWTRYMADKIPAIFIIDKNGIIRHSFYKDHTKEMPKIEEILDLVDKLAK